MFAGAFTITTPEHLHSPVMKPKKAFNVLHYLHSFVINSSSGLIIACLTSPYEKVTKITAIAIRTITRLAVISFSNMFFINDSTNH